VAQRVEIELQPLGETVSVECGTSLQDVLHRYGVEFPCGGGGSCGGCRIRVIEGSLPPSEDQEGFLSEEELARGWRLACRCEVSGGLTLHVEQWDTAILADHAALHFQPRSGHGVVVDLGTTTLVAQLLDLESGEVLAVRKALNPQGAYGADVMNRVSMGLRPEGHAKLVATIRREIGSMIDELVAASGCEAAPLDTVVIAGNTVMHHLFCGLDVEPLSRAPFDSPTGGLQEFRAGELAWTLTGDPVVRFLPCLGGFVGSDVLAGLLATKMHESEEVLALVDLGTNGEIAIGSRAGILCASTAAGPAFEGGRIEMGMQASTGAIAEVSAEAGRLRCHVIGSVAPRGICGSGLVDAVAAALDLGLIEPSGRLAAGGEPITLAPPVVLTQGDVRQLQLAKGAIAAGIQILLQRMGVAAERLSRLHLAGAFGNYVRTASARRIGLIEVDEERIEPAGNTALLGAKLALFGDGLDDGRLAEIRGRVRHVSLAEDPRFQDIFVDKTAFPK
jgi:uncharacterized 2Fe-2S/4Fe-4S cluster protein (DUF4445 family)